MALSKIYRLPDKWIALYDDNTGRSWENDCQPDEVVRIAKLCSNGLPFIHMRYEVDAIKCRCGCKEEYLFWSADSEKKEIVDNQECICPDENFKFFGIGCVCGAMKK